MDITQLLTFAVNEGASDLHLSSGEPPMLRIHGDIKRLDHPPLSGEQVHNMAFDVMGDAQRRIFQERLDIDFSFELGDLARFRVNVFMDRFGMGAVFRQIPIEIVTAETLGLSKEVLNLCFLSKGLVLVTGPHGVRQVHDPLRPH